MSTRPPNPVVEVVFYATLYAVFTLVYVPLVVETVRCSSFAWGLEIGRYVATFCAAMYVAAVVRVVMRCRRLLRVPEGCCRVCGYDLRGLGVGVVCPECGKGEPGVTGGGKQWHA